jgi:hypothetical protein
VQALIVPPVHTPYGAKPHVGEENLSSERRDHTNGWTMHSRKANTPQIVRSFGCLTFRFNLLPASCLVLFLLIVFLGVTCDGDARGGQELSGITAKQRPMLSESEKKPRIANVRWPIWKRPPVGHLQAVRPPEPTKKQGVLNCEINSYGKP